MKRFIIIVLDGFGLGAMKDVQTDRPNDTGSNTCLNILTAKKNIKLPTLEKLGLLNALEYSMYENDKDAFRKFYENDGTNLKLASTACYSYNNLAHFGADTFWGHQELLGSKPKKAITQPFSHYLQEVKTELEHNGYKTRLYPDSGSQILIVNEAMTIGDNLETDLGNNFNITAALDAEPFDVVRKVGKIVRKIAKVSRVIAFGAPGVDINGIIEAFEQKENKYAGVSAPRSGVYKDGYLVVHMGYGVDSETQVPAKLHKKGIQSLLIGKVADIAENEGGENIAGIDTKEVLAITEQKLESFQEGFICTNVQETDLAGHREEIDLYAKRLEIADVGIEKIIKKMHKNDVLIITGDHGNDPTIGHPQHTREKTPLLVYGEKIKPGRFSSRDTLSDMAATVAEFFSSESPEAGTSFLHTILGE